MDNNTAANIQHNATLVADAIYRSYAYNRSNSPDIPYDDWEQIYHNVEALEQRYQESQTVARLKDYRKCSQANSIYGAR